MAECTGKGNDKELHCLLSPAADCDWHFPSVSGKRVTYGGSPHEEDEGKGSPQGGYCKIRSFVHWRKQPSTARVWLVDTMTE